ncbi:MAG: YiiX/YebB-like N1pC/P60 family cysteine hydrolase [Steroidobacteraceae bacterium]
MSSGTLAVVGNWLARYLNRPLRDYEPFSVSRLDCLAAVLQAGDVLLVEGNLRISTPIKYLTQSTWSHAALYVGDFGQSGLGVHAPALIEAHLRHGVRAVPLTEYEGLNTRICRPVGLDAQACTAVCRFAIDRLGFDYDLKHILDLARYLLPVPPVPARWRRRMLALGSGEPTRAICSTLIAQAFQSVRYPILPQVERRVAGSDGDSPGEREVLHIRHYSLFTPRDFDLSPYFRVIKPEVEHEFDHRALTWRE